MKEINIFCYDYSDKEKTEIIEKFLGELDNMYEEFYGMSKFAESKALDYSYDSDEKAWLEEDADNLETLAGVVDDLMWNIKRYMEG